ncbi:hypothetical protein, partial [Escherichia coli]|uniref:hypothetical protein n=1 Tax=Escherichia coli TaxID=562 RepID=UPI001F1392EF
DRNRSHWSTSKTPSYTKSVSWQHHPETRYDVLLSEMLYILIRGDSLMPSGITLDLPLYLRDTPLFIVLLFRLHFP